MSESKNPGFHLESKNLESKKNVQGASHASFLYTAVIVSSRKRAAVFAHHDVGCGDQARVIAAAFGGDI